MKIKTSPYQCHLFLCTRSRGGKSKACADGGSAELKGLIKDAAKARGWKGIVRISTSGCLGLCDDGPNAVLYPQKIVFTEITEADIPAILDTIAEYVTV